MQKQTLRELIIEKGLSYNEVLKRFEITKYRLIKLFEQDQTLEYSKLYIRIRCALRYEEDFEFLK